MANPSSIAMGRRQRRDDTAAAPPARSNLCKSLIPLTCSSWAPRHQKSALKATQFRLQVILLCAATLLASCQALAPAAQNSTGATTPATGPKNASNVSASAVARPPAVATPAATTARATLSSALPPLDLAAEASTQSTARAPAGDPARRFSQRFGARLKPLARATAATRGEASAAAQTPAEYLGAASLVRASAQPASFRSQQVAARPTSQLAAQVRASPAVTSVVGVRANSAAAADDEDEADAGDEDSEALLYKMMQQQNFLLNPLWQEPGDQASGRQPAAGAQQPRAQEAGEPANSKRVIKLLKSYSHIHQVDDSDDQIRGTYTRVSAHRPPASRANEQGGARHNGADRQHIFVSSRPVSGGSSQARARISRPPGANNKANQEDDGSYHHRHTDADADHANGANPGENSRAGSGGAPHEEEDSFECPNNGIFADVASGCQSYHVCQSGAQVQEKFQCPLGTLFNDIILTCDFAHNVQCGANGSGKKLAESSQAPGPRREPADYPTRVQTAPRSAQSAQQVRSHQAARPSAGPRQLVIGNGQASGSEPSLYNLHNQRQAGSSRAQVAGTYPVALRPSADSDQDNDEPEETDVKAPLVPAQWPQPSQQQQQQQQQQQRSAVRAQMAPARVQQQQLPYKAPPPLPQPPTQKQQQQRRQPQQRPVSIQQQIPHQANRQSAHLSQFPRQTQQAQAHFEQRPRPQQPPARPQTSRNFFNSDSATAATPVFAEPNAADSSTSSPGAAVLDNKNGDVRSFSLVVNHVTPGGHEQVAPVYKSASKAEATRAQQQPQQARFSQQQAQAKPAGGSDLQRAPRHFDKQRDQPRRQQPAPDLASETGASQPAPSALATRGLVDLTNNNEQATGVGAEALNDGLLLLVRHSSDSPALQVGGFQQGDNMRLVAGPKLQQRQGAAQADRGQAFAVDPVLVRPDSPIDAQLFPNVQQMIGSPNSGGPMSQASSVRATHAAPPAQPHHHAHSGRPNGGPTVARALEVARSLMSEQHSGEQLVTAASMRSQHLQKSGRSQQALEGKAADARRVRRAKRFRPPSGSAHLAAEQSASSISSSTTPTTTSTTTSTTTTAAPPSGSSTAASGVTSAGRADSARATPPSSAAGVSATTAVGALQRPSNSTVTASH